MSVRTSTTRRPWGWRTNCWGCNVIYFDKLLVDDENETELLADDDVDVDKNEGDS